MTHKENLQRWTETALGFIGFIFLFPTALDRLWKWSADRLHFHTHFGLLLA